MAASRYDTSKQPSRVRTYSISAVPSDLKRESVVEDSVEDSFVPQTVTPRWILLLCVTIMLLTGAANTLIAKWMNRHFLKPCSTCEPRYFEGPFFQTFIMYCGQGICGIVYIVDMLLARRNGSIPVFDMPTSAKSFAKPHCPVWIWIFPMCFDFVGSTMVNYAFVIAAASTVQMLRNFNVVVTAVLTIIYLRKALRIYQWSGVGIVTIGMIIAGIYGIITPDTSTNIDSSLAWLGIVLSIGGTGLSAFQFVFEEKLFRKYRCAPLEAVGLQGGYGMFVGGIALIITQFCGFEDVKGNFYMMGQSGSLVASVILFMLCIAIFNASGLMVTKLASGLLRAIIFGTRTVIVWIVELIVKWSTFDLLNFFGLLVVTLGTFVYNHVFPVCNKKFDDFLRKPIVCCGIQNPDDPDDTEGTLIPVYATNDKNSSRSSSRSSSLTDDVVVPVNSTER